MAFRPDAVATNDAESDPIVAEPSGKQWRTASDFSLGSLRATAKDRGEPMLGVRTRGVSFIEKPFLNL